MNTPIHYVHDPESDGTVEAFAALPSEAKQFIGHHLNSQELSDGRVRLTEEDADLVRSYTERLEQQTAALHDLLTQGYTAETAQTLREYSNDVDYIPLHDRNIPGILHAMKEGYYPPHE